MWYKLIPVSSLLLLFRGSGGSRSCSGTLSRDTFFNLLCTELGVSGTQGLQLTKGGPVAFGGPEERSLQSADVDIRKLIAIGILEIEAFGADVKQFLQVLITTTLILTDLGRTLRNAVAF